MFKPVADDLVVGEVVDLAIDFGEAAHLLDEIVCSIAYFRSGDVFGSRKYALGVFGAAVHDACVEEAADLLVKHPAHRVPGLDGCFDSLREVWRET